jgi:ABC-2 type transport system ATP-binding protein
MPIIETFGLCRSFGSTIAIEDLNIKVEAGEVLGLLGPNGAGKTTTIRMLAGMIVPTKGYALLDGLRIEQNMERVHEVIGLLTESPGFYNRFSARRNLQFFAGFYPGLDADKQSEKYLKLMGLWQRRSDRVGTYSKGMKQRLALARALLHEPKVLFLDEPTAGLDPEAAREVRELIRKLGEEGRTILLSTHNLNEAESLCHHVAVIHTRLLALDTTEHLRQRFFRRQVLIQLEKPDKDVTAAVKKLSSVQDVQEEESLLSVELNEPERDRPELVKTIVEAGGQILSVSEKQYPLEEVYRRLMQEEKGR